MSAPKTHMKILGLFLKHNCLFGSAPLKWKFWVRHWIEEGLHIKEKKKALHPNHRLHIENTFYFNFNNKIYIINIIASKVPTFSSFFHFLQGGCHDLPFLRSNISFFSFFFHIWFIPTLNFFPVIIFSKKPNDFLPLYSSSCM